MVGSIFFIFGMIAKNGFPKEKKDGNIKRYISKDFVGKKCANLCSTDLISLT